MSSNSITEKEGSKDNYYVQTVSMDAPPPLQHASPIQRTYGNPAPLGMMAYGTVFLVSSILTLASKQVGGSASLVLVFAAFYGGISQTLVGWWEMWLGNTFSATVFCTYGGFNFTYGALYLPQIGIAAAYSVNGVIGKEFFNMIGIYLAVWDFITFIFLLGALRSTVPIIFTLSATIVALTCLAINSFTGNPAFATAGGAMGIVASFGAYYGAMTSFWTQQTTFSFIRLPHLSVAPSNV